MCLYTEEVSVLIHGWVGPKKSLPIWGLVWRGSLFSCRYKKTSPWGGRAEIDAPHPTVHRFVRRLSNMGCTSLEATFPPSGSVDSS